MKHKILVVEDKSIFREPLVGALEGAGYTVTRAEHGQAALAGLELQVPDLIVLDLAMPRLDGITFLRRLRGNPDWRALPVIVLTGATDEDSKREAIRLGVVQYLTKSEFSLADLLKHIATGLEQANQLETSALEQPIDGRALQDSEGSAAGVTSIGDSEVSIEDLKRALLLGKKSPELSRQIALQHADSAIGTELTSLFEQNTLLRERILAIVNTKLYTARYGPIESLAQAVEKLGPHQMRGLVLTFAIMNCIADPEPNDVEIRFWKHSLAVIELMRRVSTSRDDEEFERLMLIGLCHDLGELAFAREFPKDFERANSEAIAENSSAIEVRKRLVSIPDATLVECVLKEFEIPDTVLLPIREHLSAAGDVCSEGMSSSACLLGIANYLAHGLWLATTKAARVRPIDPDEYRSSVGVSSAPKIDPEELLSGIDELLHAYLGTQHSLAGLLQSETRPSNKVLWYARHRGYGYGETEPVAFALNGLCEIQTHSTLPPTQERLSTYCGAVVVVPDASTELLTTFHCARLLGEEHNPESGIVYLYHESSAEKPEQRAGVHLATIPLSLHSLEEAVRKLLVR